MSALARPQGTPDRVWSYVAGLAALGGRAPRDDIEGLFNPGYRKDGQEILTKENLAGDTFGAATSLNLVVADRQQVWLGEGLEIGSQERLADDLHDRLCTVTAENTNRVMLETYAWMAAESDRQGHLDWIYDWGRDELADRANEGLSGEDEDKGRLMNSTKMVAWRRWMGFLGLSLVLPLQAPDYPLHAARTARELARAGLGAGQALTGEAFMDLVSQRQPYLDGGRLFAQACARIGHTPQPSRLSPLMSAGLRDLHDQKVLTLTLSGDSGGGFTLTGDDAHAMPNFNAVTIGVLEALA
jgi:hypothetical protein